MSFRFNVNNYIFLLICFSRASFCFAQSAADTIVSNLTEPADPGFVIIDKIYVEGHKKTNTDIIIRELDFKVGDTIHLDNLSQRLELNQYNILNSGLFNEAIINFKDWEGATNKVGINISVKEGWYVFPFPIVELADRNFNVWWSTYERSLQRLNLGLRFYHTNFTGRRDQLKAVVQFGFTKKYELIYTLPTLNKSKTLGINFNILHTREKEIGYTTLENELQFHRNDNNILLQRFRIGAGLRYRKHLDFFHQLDLSYRDHAIDESVPQELNPDFFLGGLSQRFFSANYRFTIDKRDIRPYPMKGFLIRFQTTKNGIFNGDNVQSLDLISVAQKYFSLGEKWSLALMAKGKTGLQRKKQPYYNSRALGYNNDFIRGYEFYVIDGLDYAYFKQALRFNLYDRIFNWGPYMKLESFKLMPVKLFLVLHNEMGYVNNPFYNQNNSLSNDFLWGTGIGLDLILYYDKIFNFEYSRNHLGEHGFFLHWTFSF